MAHCSQNQLELSICPSDKSLGLLFSGLQVRASFESTINILISLAILQGLFIKVVELALQSSHTVFSSFLLLISLMDSVYRII